MDHGTLPPAGTLNLFGVRKTLRQLYAPTTEPNEAIIRALQALARLERVEPTTAIVNAARLAPAA